MLPRIAGASGHACPARLFRCWPRCILIDRWSTYKRIIARSSKITWPTFKIENTYHLCKLILTNITVLITVKGNQHWRKALLNSFHFNECLRVSSPESHLRTTMNRVINITRAQDVLLNCFYLTSQLLYFKITSNFNRFIITQKRYLNDFMWVLSSFVRSFIHPFFYSLFLVAWTQARLPWVKTNVR